MIRLFFIVAGVSAALVCAVQWLAAAGWLSREPSFLFQTVFILAFATLIICRYLLKVSKPEQFVQLFLLFTVVKMVGLLAYAFFMALRHREAASENILFFLVAYFVFTAVEIVFLYLHTRGKSRP